MPLFHRSAVELRDLVRSGEITAVDVVESFLSRIDDVEPSVSAYLKVFGDKAVERAKQIDGKKHKGGLAGVPIAVKDNIMLEGEPTSCASRMLENYSSHYSASVIRRLEEQDALFLGKTNMDEFAMGSSTENSAFKKTRNPWNLERVPGGSSGGAAAAVGAGEAAGAVGSDTGGSIRQPASFCGLVGLKPTYGRVSRYGLVAFASSLDVIGPLARTVADCALLMQCIAGYDPEDSTSMDYPVPDYSPSGEGLPSSWRIGCLKAPLLKGVSPEVRSSYRQVLDILEEEGVQLVEMDFPSWNYALQCYYVIAPAEASSNLARFDGVRYGFGPIETDDLEEMYVRIRTEGFGEEVKRRILMGTFALSSGYRDAYYLKAMGMRKLLRRELEKAFEQVDFILTPTADNEAFPFGAKKDPVAMYRCDQFTVVANLAGIPALSQPVSMSRNGLPLGIQLLGNFFGEKALLKLAFLLEKKVKFKTQIPRISRRRKDD